MIQVGVYSGYRSVLQAGVRVGSTTPRNSDLDLRSPAALQLENMALRHQTGVQRSAVKRTKLAPGDRLFWIIRSDQALAGIPENVVLYCARHRFSTDAMEGAGNLLAVMDAMGHGPVKTTRVYARANAALIREAIEHRNKSSATASPDPATLTTKEATIE